MITKNNFFVYLALALTIFVTLFLPVAAAASSAGPFAYITNEAKDNVSVVNVTNNTILKTIAVGIDPCGIVVSSDGKRAYCVNGGTNGASSISVINTTNNSVITNINTGTYSYGIAINPTGTRVYVGNDGATANNVSVINTTTNTVIATVKVGTFPLGLVVNPQGTRVYVTNRDTNNISIIDTNTNALIGSINTGNQPWGIDISPDGSVLYVANYMDDTVSAISTTNNSILYTAAVGNRPMGIVVTPDGKKVYTTNYGYHSVSILNTVTRIVTNMNIGNNPYGVAVTSDGKSVYVVNRGDNKFSQINTSNDTIVNIMLVGTGVWQPVAFGKFIGPLLTSPIANFTSNVTNGIIPCTISFTDTSANFPTSWSWNFGDGNTSTQQNPVYIYTSTGIYNISLTATNIYGNNTLTKTSYINITEPACLIQSSYTSNSTNNIIQNTTIFFNETSINARNTTWYINDVATQYNNSVNSAQFTWNFTTLGDTNITVIVNNTNNSVTKQWDYTVYPIVDANFTVNITSGFSPLTVIFNDLSDGSPTQWLWDFGDGTTSDEQNSIHTYQNAGIYTVNLTAQNNGSSNTAIQTNIIVVSPAPILPIANFGVNKTSGYVPLTIKCTDTSQYATSWQWNFADGTENSTEQSPIHTFTTSGSRKVILTAINDNGTNSKSRTIMVMSRGPVRPVANFVSNVTNGTVPLDVQFNDTSTNTPTSWSWDFGDSAFSTLQNPVHTYTIGGSYTVTLVVANSAGSATKVDVISAMAIPIINWTEPNDIVYETPLNETQLNAVASVDGEYMYSPDHGTVLGVGDQTLHVDFSPMDNTGYLSNSAEVDINVINATPVIVWDNPIDIVNGTQLDGIQLNATTSELGDFTYDPPAGVALNVGTHQLNTTFTPDDLTNFTIAYANVTINVTEHPPIANFTQNITSGMQPLSVQFVDQSTYNPTAWLWDFGDGSSDTIQNPIHTYQNVGNYTVSLNASNIGGSNISTSTIEVNVAPILPIAKFTVNRTSGYVPLTIKFTDTSQYATSWQWGFGDGTANSTEQSPVHTFTTSGSRKVILTAINSNGTHSKSSTITVMSRGPVRPVANFVVNVSSGNVPFGVQFTDTSTNTPTSWLWDFGDSATSTLQNPTYIYNMRNNYTVTLTATNSAGSNSKLGVISAYDQVPLSITLYKKQSIPSNTLEDVAINTSGVTASTKSSAASNIVLAIADNISFGTFLIVILGAFAILRYLNFF